MILYSVLPADLVWEDASRPAAPVYEVALPGNARLLLAPAGPLGWRVLRLLSTEPRDYWVPQWQPGSYLPGRSRASDRGP